MNELIFFGHIFIVIAIIIYALKLGKEALIIIFCLFALLANFLVLKEIRLFGWAITCSDAYSIGCFLSLSYINAYFGDDLAKKSIRLCTLTLLVFSAAGLIHILYKPAPSDHMHSFYKTLLINSPRIVVSSIIITLSSQKLCLFLQRLFTKVHMPMSLCIPLSIIFSHLFDTVAFSYAALYGKMSHMSDIIIISFLVKVLCLLIFTPFISLTQKIIKPPEQAL